MFIIKTMEKYVISLCLYSNIKKIIPIKVLKAISYDELLQIASNKFRTKIIMIVDENNVEFVPEILNNNLKLICYDHKVKTLSYKNDYKSCIKIDIVAFESYIHYKALDQLNSLKNIEGVKYVCGMPDLHIGVSYPIGAVVIGEKLIPELIGEDIGCGALFVKTNIDSDISKKKLQKISNNLYMENPYYKYQLECPENIRDIVFKYDQYSGTIGRGNHFAELQIIDEIHDDCMGKKYNLEMDKLYITIHSGSRGLGEEILNMYKNKVIDIDKYKELHDYALKFAKNNRLNIADRFIQHLVNNDYDDNYSNVCDIFHNYYETKSIDGNLLYIHRKGAISCDNELSIILGSRGSRTYLVQPIRNDVDHGFSISHGAGRKLSRSVAYSKLNSISEYDRQKKLQNSLIDNIVICEDKHMFYEEAPIAYKNIDLIISDLVRLNIIKIIAILKPLITYKMRQ